KTGIQSCIDDIYAWMEFYDAPLKNCALAIFELRDNHDAHHAEHRHRIQE
ncbi:hypothetical protein C8J56DRAFT_790198, partial [Mycena floridula]